MPEPAQQHMHDSLTLTLMSWSLYFLLTFLKSFMSFSKVLSCACREVNSPPMWAY